MSRLLLAAWPLAIAIIVAGPTSSVGQTQAETNEEAAARLRAAEAEQKQILEELRAKAHGSAQAL